MILCNFNEECCIQCPVCRIYICSRYFLSPVKINWSQTGVARNFACSHLHLKSDIYTDMDARAIFNRDRKSWSLSHIAPRSVRENIFAFRSEKNEGNTACTSGNGTKDETEGEMKRHGICCGWKSGRRKLKYAPRAREVVKLLHQGILSGRPGISVIKL